MASQSASLRKALGTKTRMVAARPLVAGSFTSATETAGVGRSGRPWRERATPQNVARETWPPGAFQGNRCTVSASVL
eukprot:3834733-Alexandrium_andersonii.AAC.1